MTELKDQLSLLGRKTEYKQDYAPEVLEAFDPMLAQEYTTIISINKAGNLCFFQFMFLLVQA